MRRRLTIRPQARTEFLEAIAWYESQRAGLGADFIEAVQAAIDRIMERPDANAKAFDDIRRCLVRRFPYAVHYRVKPDRITVVAVFHARCDPGILRRRTENDR